MWLKGWRVGGVDHALDVDAGAVGEARELVGERDVDVAVGRLGELRELGRLGRPHGPHLGVQERAVELDAARARRASLSPPTSFGYVARSAKTRPLKTRSGLKTRVEVRFAAQAAAARRARARSRPRVVPTGTVVSTDTTVPGPQAGADVGEDGVERSASPGRAPASTISGGTAMTRSAPSATAAVVSRRRAQAPGADDLGERLGEAGLAGERRRAALTSVDDVARSTSQPTTSWPGARDLDGERQADLAERDDDRALTRAARGATVSPDGRRSRARPRRERDRLEALGERHDLRRRASPASEVGEAPRARRAAARAARARSGSCRPR